MPIVLLDERDKAEIQEQIDTAAAKAAVKANILEKRITNLEQGILPSPFVTDDGVAYQKSVPSNALPYAEVEKIGGMTRKCANLLDTFGVSTTKDGLTIASEADAHIKINGEKYGMNLIKLKTFNGFVLPVGTYVFSAKLISGNFTHPDNPRFWAFLNDSAYLCEGGSTILLDVTKPLAIESVGLQVLDYTVFENAVVEIMLNEGSTALPYEPYFEGLRSAPVSAVESVGANLFDKSKVINATETETGFKFTNTSADGTPYLIGYLKNLAPTLKVGDVIYFYSDNINDWHDYPFLYLNGTAKAWYGSNAHTVSQADLDGEVYAYGLQNKVCEFNNMRITKNENAPYSPYVRNTLPIPSAVQALEGYGEGINESVYNYIDWEKKQFVKRVGKVDLGTLSWGTTDVSCIYNAPVTGIKLPTNDYERREGWLCSAFRPSVQLSAGHLDDLGMIKHPSGTIYARDYRYTTVADFKTAMQGEMLYYELAEPIITDISDILSDDNFIGVEGGGTVTFKNEYEYAVPSEITYQIKGANV